MRVYDPIYGAFEVPSFLRSLALAPEVRRLSNVRLLNTTAPSTATLSDLRRYSHTLGVLHLCLRARLVGFSAEERRALLASVLVHDVGTPPFGHLLERLLAERDGWNHESIARSVLLGQSVSANAAHEIFANRGVKFLKLLDKANVDIDLVLSILEKKHPLSLLLFGSLDFDNIDNVVRMGWSLGMDFDRSMAARVAGELSVCSDGNLCLPVELSSDVENWLVVRSSVYKVLFFDFETVASQALLSKVVSEALDRSEISDQDWSLTDEQLLAKLSSNKESDQRLMKAFLGELPTLAFCIHVCSGSFIDGLDRASIYKAVIDSFDSNLRKEIVPFVQVDRKTFQRQLNFFDQRNSSEWSVGINSFSMVVYAFSFKGELPKAVRSASASRFVETMGLSEEHVINIILDRGGLNEGQGRLDL